MTTMAMTPRATLQPGQRAPNFALPNSDGQMERLYDRFVGNLVILFFFSSQESPEAVQELRGFVARPEALVASGTAFLAVTRDKVATNAALQTSLGIRFPLYADEEGAITEGYGATPRDGVADCTSYLLDRNQRVLAVFKGGVDHADRVLAHLRDQGLVPPAGRTICAQAPVLLVPNVFDPALCARAIAAWQDSHAEGEVAMPERAYAAAATERPANTVYYNLKKRRDHVADDNLNPVLMEIVMSRLAPELRKVFQFRVGGLERFCIGAYEAQRQDYFRPHRDNITENTKHRRFAVTISLNDDYEGGGVKFAEFSEDIYKPPAGCALVFSCSLLHEALPVTRGRRLATFTFLFGQGSLPDGSRQLPVRSPSPGG